jgi:hypothetical protein
MEINVPGRTVVNDATRAGHLKAERSEAWVTRLRASHALLRWGGEEPILVTR